MFCYLCYCSASFGLSSALFILCCACFLCPACFLPLTKFALAALAKSCYCPGLPHSHCFLCRKSNFSSFYCVKQLKLNSAAFMNIFTVEYTSKHFAKLLSNSVCVRALHTSTNIYCVFHFISNYHFIT